MTVHLNHIMSNLRYLFLVFLVKLATIIPSSSRALLPQNRVRRHAQLFSVSALDGFTDHEGNERSRRSSSLLLFLQQAGVHRRDRRDLLPFTPFSPMKSLGSLPNMNLDKPDWSSLSNLNLRPSYSAATSLSQAQHVNRKNPSLSIASALAFTLDIQGPLGSSSSQFQGNQNTGQGARSGSKSVAGKKNGTASANADTNAQIVGPSLGQSDHETASTINKANIFVGGNNAVANSNAQGTVGGDIVLPNPPAAAHDQVRSDLPRTKNLNASERDNGESSQKQREQQQPQQQRRQSLQQGALKGNSPSGNTAVALERLPIIAITTTSTTTTATTTATSTATTITTTTTTATTTTTTTTLPITAPVGDASNTDSFFTAPEGPTVSSSNSQWTNLPPIASNDSTRRRTFMERGRDRRRQGFF